YISSKKFLFVNYLSNIGGLISLWFGVSFIDSSALIRHILNSIKFIIISYINIDLLRKLRRVLTKIQTLIKMIMKLNWNKIIFIISLPIVCYQVYELIDKYLQFST